jgi:hypothetical protein
MSDSNLFLIMICGIFFIFLVFILLGAELKFLTIWLLTSRVQINKIGIIQVFRHFLLLHAQCFEGLLSFLS